MLAVAAHSPSNPEVQVVLGVLYNISQDFDSAIDCFRHAIELSPPDYSLLNKVCHSYPVPFCTMSLDPNHSVDMSAGVVFCLLQCIRSQDFTSMADNFPATLLHNCITNVQ